MFAIARKVKAGARRRGLRRRSRGRWGGRVVPGRDRGIRSGRPRSGLAEDGRAVRPEVARRGSRLPDPDTHGPRRLGGTRRGKSTPAPTTISGSRLSWRSRRPGCGPSCGARPGGRARSWRWVPSPSTRAGCGSRSTTSRSLSPLEYRGLSYLMHHAGGLSRRASSWSISNDTTMTAIRRRSRADRAGFAESLGSTSSRPAGDRLCGGRAAGMTGGSLKNSLRRRRWLDRVRAAIAGIGLLLLFERHLERRITLELESHLRQLVERASPRGDGALERGPSCGAQVQRAAERALLANRGGAGWAVLRSRLFGTPCSTSAGSAGDRRGRWHTIRVQAVVAARHRAAGRADRRIWAAERSGGGRDRPVGESVRRPGIAGDLVPSLGLLAAFWSWPRGRKSRWA